MHIVVPENVHSIWNMIMAWNNLYASHLNAHMSLPVQFQDINSLKMHSSPPLPPPPPPPPGGLGCCPFSGGGSVFVDLLLNVLPIVCGSSVFVFVLLCITLCPFIVKRKRKLLYRCVVTINVLWLFLALTWIGLQFVVVVFPDHTHLIFGDHDAIATTLKVTILPIKKLPIPAR